MTRRTPALAPLNWKIARDEIVRALREYKGTSIAGSRYFIWFKGQSFPPKEIRSIVEKRAKKTFSGGGKTNQMFRQLGFAVVRGRNHLPAYQQFPKYESGVQRRIWDFSNRLERLFRERWKPLKNQLDSGDTSTCPGVYILAYARDLESKLVKPEDIFYVGMSTTSLKKRLKQFWDGIHDGGHHSGAMTFYQRWAGGRPFDKISHRGTFYVATVPIDCETRKGLRTSADLEDLGLVAALEFHILAHIKRKMGLEPPLNKK
jgi:hypothetical protein